MAESLARFAARDALISIDGSGSVSAIEHRARPGLCYLSLGLPDAPDTVLTEVAIAVDADEVEAVLGDGSGLAVSVRHSFVGGWRFRVVLSSSADRLRRLRLRVPFDLGAGVVASAVAEGAEAELCVQPADGRGPVLVGRLRQGSIERITERGLELAEVTLAPGARYVVAWEWDWLSRPSAYVRKWPINRPSVPTWIRGQTVTVPAGPDVAFVAPPGLGVERVEDGYELTADEPGSARVELRSIRGVRTIELTWTPTPAEVLRQAATDVLAESRRSAGVVVLPGIEAALVVQQAVTAELLADPDEARDALDRNVARFDRGLEELDLVLGALFLCGEHARTGEQGLLEDATAAIRRVDRPVPGLGLVATRICVARLLAGLSPQPVMDRLLVLGSDLEDHLAALTDAAGAGRGEAAAAAELLAVTSSSAEQLPGRRSPDQDPLLRLLLVIGAEVSAGLPGNPIGPLPITRLGHLLATLAVSPDDLAAPTRRFWGISARDLAERTTPMLLARLAGRPAGLGHVWLGLLVGAR